MGLLSHLDYTGDLFDPTAVSVVLKSLLPLYDDDGREENICRDDDVGELEGNVCPKVATRNILKAILHEEYCFTKISTVDEMVFSFIMHASIQREAAEKKLW